MSIKKRILISNLLMLVIPAILSVFVVLIVFFVFTGVINLPNSSAYFNSERFGRMVDQADNIFNAWSTHFDLQSVMEDIDQFNLQNQQDGFTLSLYRKNTLVYPKYPVSPQQNKLFTQNILISTTAHTGALDNFAFYSKPIGDYTAVLICSEYVDFGINYLKYKSTIIGFIALVIILVILIIAVTNYLLTQNLIKRIITPLEILNYGVHQIHLGNLDYRIIYKGNDEFSVVCSDFNIMAQRLRESVDQREKNEQSRKQLIAGISHDLRTPLTSIKAYVEGLMDGIANTEQLQRTYLETIQTKAENIDQILDQLALFSKLDTGEFPFYPERLDIGKELSDYVAKNSAEYKAKGLSIKLNNNLQNAMISLDPVQFENVLTNILENSVKYKNKEQGIIEITLSEQNHHVCITLSDDGPGVPQESLGKLFDMFFRVDPSRNNPSKGSGLGLAICGKIIEIFGGEIHAENNSGGGLTIRIVLPKSE